MFNLKMLLDNHGQLTATDLEDFAKSYPKMYVVIKYGMSERVRILASLALDDVKVKGKRGNYVREVFISASDLDLIRVILGEPVKS